MDRRAVAGPFEDLPSLLIVIVATGLFLSMAARALILVRESRAANEREERALRLLSSAMTLKGVMSREGVVDLRGAGLVDASDIAGSLGWLEGGWRLNISWSGGWLEWSSGPASGERASAQASVVVDAGRNLPGRLTAVVWDE